MKRLSGNYIRISLAMLLILTVGMGYWIVSSRAKSLDQCFPRVSWFDQDDMEHPLRAFWGCASLARKELRKNPNNITALRFSAFFYENYLSDPLEARKYYFRASDLGDNYSRGWLMVNLLDEHHPDLAAFCKLVGSLNKKIPDEAELLSAYSDYSEMRSCTRHRIPS